MYAQQECIPVGCVPATHWPYAAVFFRGGCLHGPGGFSLPGRSPCRGVSLPGGVSAWSRGVSLPGGVSAWSRGVSLPGGCLPGPGGVSAWSGGWFSLPRGGVCLVLGGLPGDPLPPVNRITDTFKTITLATTSLRPVINFCKQCISLLLTRRAVFLVRFRLSPNLFFCVTFN